MSKELIKASKFLSLVLRHKPQVIGMELDSQGWVSVNELIKAYNSHRSPVMTQELLDEVVRSNNKKRFEYNEDKSKIRARQGHSVDVDLGYKSVTPPYNLYHGTSNRFLSSIMTDGISKMSRHHVHLSEDKATAINVGKRHGKPVVITVSSAQMHADGYKFFKTDNNVWLVDEVCSRYFESIDFVGNDV